MQSVYLDQTLFTQTRILFGVIILDCCYEMYLSLLMDKVTVLQFRLLQQVLRPCCVLCGM